MTDMQGATRRIAGLQSHLNHVQGSGEEDEQPVGSVWTNMPQAPPDPILGLTEAFKADPSPSKLNLGVGAYRTEEGKPLVLEVVKKAVARIVSNPAGNKEYLGIAGLPEFCDRARALAFGEYSEGVTSQRIATVQSLSGTGALRVGAEFLQTHYPVPVVYLPQPTWGNHKKIFPNAGLAVRTYRYYHPASRGLDFEGMVEDLKSAEPGAVVLLHACAHNPTGVDPGREQWCQLLEVVRSRRLLPFFDSAYQGFASGDLDQDAFALRLFAESGLQMLLAQSFAKNMGLYGERAGALSVVSADREEAARVLSQLKQVVRPMYSNPPRHGAEIVATVLGDATLFAEWKVELKEMAGRIQAMRQALYDELSARGVPGTWTHILHQIGMFTFTGLTAAQVDHLIRRWHIYLTADGRISMAGLSRSSCGYLADAILDAIRTC